MNDRCVKYKNVKRLKNKYIIPKKRKKLQQKCAKLQQSCNNVEELILHLDYNVTVSHRSNTSLVTLQEAQ